LFLNSVNFTHPLNLLSTSPRDALLDFRQLQRTFTTLFRIVLVVSHPILNAISTLTLSSSIINADPSIVIAEGIWASAHLYQWSPAAGINHTEHWFLSALFGIVDITVTRSRVFAISWIDLSIFCQSSELNRCKVFKSYRSFVQKESESFVWLPGIVAFISKLRHIVC
jgi:hypothetical protein